ncbi:MFS transporter [Streptomyces siamensis]|uniref:MFS transporter n=1 Tax=Streptomyces siamensis TaxID=1274986 RepID=A0ABP9J665_9ACTN
MSSAPRPAEARTPVPTPGDNPRRWLGLVFIGLAQLMIVLDITVVNIALPSAQQDLGISAGDRQWVITAYTLAFGSLLLLGGRIADYTGRKRAFLIGLIGFACASALGGAATGFTLLLAARALQGGFAALLAPAALSLLSISFTESRERAKAFGVYGAIAAGGSAIGLLLGGLLTEYLDWRWCLYVNVPIAVIAACGWSVLPADRRATARARLDLPGALLATSGLVAAVYGCSKAESDGWDSPLVMALLTSGVCLLVGFALFEARSPRPLLPLRVVTDRTRASAYLAVALAVIGMFGMFLFLTYYMQVVKDYSAVLTGVAFLPLTAGVLVSAGGIASRLLPRVAPRALVVPGLLLAAVGTGWLIPLEADTSYATGVLPAEIIVGLGMGLVMAPAMNYATHGVRPEDSGVASAMANTSQQIGASIGTALLNTIAIDASTDYLAGRRHTPDVLREALVEGFSTAYSVATVILVAAALVIAVLMNAPRPATVGEARREPAPHMG